MLFFVIVLVLTATMLVAGRVASRTSDDGCRYRCHCIDDSVALGPLASIAARARDPRRTDHGPAASREGTLNVDSAQPPQKL